MSAPPPYDKSQEAAAGQNYGGGFHQPPPANQGYNPGVGAPPPMIITHQHQILFDKDPVTMTCRNCGSNVSR